MNSEFATGSSSPAVPGAAAARERLLYIDDYRALVTIATRTLSRLGYTVTGCTSGAQAVETFKADPRAFDAIVTDLSMPSMSGFALAETLRRLRPDIPVLMMSGYVRPEDQARVSEEGIDALLTKPVAPEDLRTALDAALARRRAAAPATPGGA